mgnify:CR=1 FL=1
MTTFTINTTYRGRDVCDSSYRVHARVAKRTAKSVTLTDGKRYMIKVINDCEVIFLGKDAYAPVIRASNPVR